VLSFIGNPIVKGIGAPIVKGKRGKQLGNKVNDRHWNR